MTTITAAATASATAEAQVCTEPTSLRKKPDDPCNPIPTLQCPNKIPTMIQIAGNLSPQAPLPHICPTELKARRP